MNPMYSKPLLYALAVFLAGLGPTALAKEKTEEFHQTYPLAADGKVQLDNVNGKVVITTWEQLEIKIDAVKKADKQADLEAIEIEVESKPNQIRIHTKLPETHSGWKFLKHESGSTSVNYDIKVPAGVRLEEIRSVNGSIDIEGVQGKVNASTVNGRLTAKGLASDAQLHTVNGAVQAEFDELEAAKSVSLNSVNGAVKLTLPANADAEVSAHTVNGRIHTPAEIPATKTWPIGGEVKGTLGKGTTRVKVETVNGGIRIDKAGS